MDSSAAEKRPLIEIINISFSYGYGEVLTQVSFPVNNGDFLAIIGPNGSGKTTLVKIVLGLLKPSQGEVKIMGKPVEDFMDWRLIGYVPQKASHVNSFFPVSVKEVVAMGILSRKKFPGFTKQEDQSITRALQQVNMEGYKNRRIGNLSAGQQQRIFISRAIVNKPKVLILDEPTAGVDAETQSRFYDMLHSLNEKEGITTVLVTHEIGIINKHVNQVACLNQKLVYHGTHAEFCRSKEFKNMLAEGHHVISHRH